MFVIIPAPLSTIWQTNSIFAGIRRYNEMSQPGIGRQREEFINCAQEQGQGWRKMRRKSLRAQER